MATAACPSCYRWRLTYQGTMTRRSRSAGVEVDSPQPRRTAARGSSSYVHLAVAVGELLQCHDPPEDENDSAVNENDAPVSEEGAGCLAPRQHTSSSALMRQTTEQATRSGFA